MLVKVTRNDNRQINQKMNSVSYYIGALCLLTGSLLPSSQQVVATEKVIDVNRAPFFRNEPTDQKANSLSLTSNLKSMAIAKTYSVNTWPQNFDTNLMIDLPGNFPLEKGNWNLEIYDIEGQKLREIEGLRTRSYTLKRGNLESGIYLLKVTQRQKFMGVTKVLAN